MMDDPIQRHPTREEQLDILTSIIADTTSSGDALLDVGCGTGYVARLLLAKAPGRTLHGVDISNDALARAAKNLEGLDAEFSAIAGDLMRPESIALPRSDYAAAYTCLTFHDLSDDAKRAVIGWVAGRLRPGGVFYIYDRIRLTEPLLFAQQRSIWSRIERIHGRGMRTAETFAAYIEDLGSDNKPACLEDYLTWYREANLAPACLHLHGNVALLAGAKP